MNRSNCHQLQDHKRFHHTHKKETKIGNNYFETEVTQVPTNEKYPNKHNLSKKRAIKD